VEAFVNDTKTYSQKFLYFYKFIRNFLMNAYKLEEIAGHFGK
jgi:hypothetical protein